MLPQDLTNSSSLVLTIHKLPINLILIIALSECSWISWLTLKISQLQHAIGFLPETPIDLSQSQLWCYLSKFENCFRIQTIFQEHIHEVYPKLNLSYQRECWAYNKFGCRLNHNRFRKHQDVWCNSLNGPMCPNVLDIWPKDCFVRGLSKGN